MTFYGFLEVFMAVVSVLAAIFFYIDWHVRKWDADTEDAKRKSKVKE